MQRRSEELRDELDRFVASRVEGGRYADGGEAVNEGVMTYSGAGSIICSDAKQFLSRSS